ncbi:hypothetical protein J4Q44_G00232560 [Coregonus suidteri]|uniref:tRNA (32-2'-O)-methyltransferase regulator THADA-like C-terminal TPR repeats region domain-containing protein n=1 Tax=Coregonus suidteri TaxID=861788 RepID=A0AAN8LR54_9TELE
MTFLINWVKQRGRWDFFSRSKQLLLNGCLEDSTNEVCTVHTLQAMVQGSGLGVAVLKFAPAVAILSLTLLCSPCWATRNAALQLYCALCSRMLGQCSGGEEGSIQQGMSPPAFFTQYPTLHPFLLGELRGAAGNLHGP